MAYKETPIHVRCAITKQPETVYVRTLDYQDIHLKEFNGCGNNFHGCEQCNIICQEAAMKKHAQIVAAGPPPWMHMP